MPKKKRGVYCTEVASWGRTTIKSDRGCVDMKVPFQRSLQGGGEKRGEQTAEIKRERHELDPTRVRLSRRELERRGEAKVWRGGSAFRPLAEKAGDRNTGGVLGYVVPNLKVGGEDKRSPHAKLNHRCNIATQKSYKSKAQEKRQKRGKNGRRSWCFGLLEPNPRNDRENREWQMPVKRGVE